MALSWTCAAGTDRGLRRARNEDALLVLPSAGLYAVADGMGGHAAGDVASRTATRVLSESFEQPPPARQLRRHLVEAFSNANRAILEQAAADPSMHGMGTTLTALAMPPRGHGVIVHIGDSRAYRMRDGNLEQLTADHTWVQQQVDAGVLAPEAVRGHPYASVLLRVLGTAEDAAPDEFEIEARRGDLFLLCSDGLSGVAGDDAIRTILAEDSTLEAKKDRLIAAALEAGGPDNISVVLLRAG